MYSSKRFWALLLVVVTIMTMLCSCSYSIEVPSDHEILLDTRDPVIAEAFTNAKYDITITLTKVIEALSFVKLYEYDITIDIYEKTNPAKPCATYEVDEIFFFDKEVCDVLDYHESPALVRVPAHDAPELVPLLQKFLEELARTSTLISINHGGLSVAEEESQEIMSKLAVSPIEGFLEIAHQYEDGLDEKDIVEKSVEILENFPMPDSFTYMVRNVFVRLFTLGNTVESKNDADPAKLMENKFWEMLFGIDSTRENYFSVIASTDIDAHKELLGEKADAFAEKIIALFNES